MLTIGYVRQGRIPVTLKCLKQKEPEFEPRTLGEHFKRYRLQRKLSQIAAARVLEVNPCTILNWEKGHTEPPVEAVPAPLRFLGYDPFPEPRTLAERLLAMRRAMGWSIRQAARQLGVDRDIDRVMGARWILSHEKESVAKSG